MWTTIQTVHILTKYKLTLLAGLRLAHFFPLCKGILKTFVLFEEKETSCAGCGKDGAGDEHGCLEGDCVGDVAKERSDYGDWCAGGESLDWEDGSADFWGDEPIDVIFGDWASEGKCQLEEDVKNDGPDLIDEKTDQEITN